MSLAGALRDLIRSFVELGGTLFSVSALLAQMATTHVHTVTRSYQTEFPDFDTELPTLEGFHDESWHNDACPKLVSEDRKLGIWVDYLDPDLRESSGGKRFIVSNFEVEPSMELFSSDDWDQVVSIVKLARNAIEAEMNRTTPATSAPMGSRRIVEVV